MDCSPPGSSISGISQARILEWVVISFCRVSSWPRDWTCIFCIASSFFYFWATGESSQFNPVNWWCCSCLENPMDRGAWWATIHGVTKSRTQLSDFCVCVCVELNYFFTVSLTLELVFPGGKLLKSRTMMVASSLSPCSSISFCHVYFHTLLLST